MRTILKTLHLWNSGRGSASVEFAILLPFLAFLVIGSGDIARIVYAGISLESAVRVGTTRGAQLLGKPGLTIKDVNGNVIVPASVIDSMRQSATAEALVGSTFTVEALCRCRKDNPSEHNSGTLGACVGIKAIQDCGKDQDARESVEVFLNMTGTTQLNLFWDFYRLPGTFTAQRQAMVAAY